MSVSIYFLSFVHILVRMSLCLYVIYVCSSVVSKNEKVKKYTSSLQ